MGKTKSELENLLQCLEGHKIVVMGDVMLDEYLFGGTKRVSPEAPVLVVDVDHISWAPGGAANVAANIKALGGEVCLVGIVGSDDAGRRLKEQLVSMGVNVEGLLEDPERVTTLKTRIIAGHQQVVRVDREKRDLPDRKLHKKLQSLVQEKLEWADGIMASDYDKGMTGQLTLDAVALARKSNKVFTCNPKPRNLRWFHGAHLMTLNHFEAEAAAGETIDSDKSLEKAGQRILEKTEADTVVVTRGPNGMNIFRKGLATEHVPGMPVEVYDVAGAGDTVVSTLTLALASGADPVTSARLANFAAATVVRKLGVASAIPSEIAHLIQERQ